MSYLVLARKWRPRAFDTLIGQDHVVRALTHALSTQRLHHAWLFTGTRGVGKTTLSRILAKSLNCETGITATPCGVCQACTEIDAGRFVDYLELDAASNRGVDEMTQLLEQAVYSPSAGRFKVYMIDEVHMLTGHAFNAMLKTLEEPPAHVKFILATTDPQKIPVTVLSRCLQFNLKQMPAESIVGHLQYVLGEEQIPFELPALRLLGQAASGSMRDALSLTDQAIAYSAGNLTQEAVRGMLGTIDQRHLVRLLDALSAGQASAVLEVADELATRGLSYRAALADLAILLSRVAIAQRLGQTLDETDPLAEDIKHLAQLLHPDALQLFYTVAVHSRAELAIAPDEYAGFVMACLRMLSLYAGAAPPRKLDSTAEQTTETVTPGTQAIPEAVSEPSGMTPVASTQPAASLSSPVAITSGDLPTHATVAFKPAVEMVVVEENLADNASTEPPDWATQTLDEDFERPDQTVQANTVSTVLQNTEISLNQPWPSLSANLGLTGIAAQLAKQSECIGITGNTIILRVATKALTEGVSVERLRSALNKHLGVPVQLRFEIGTGSGQSAHALEVAAQDARQSAAEKIVDRDPFVQALVRDFGAQVIPGSVQPGPSLI